MFCRYCGKEITDEATFCRHCGRKVKKVRTGSLPFLHLEKKYLFVLASIVLCSCLTFLGIAILSKLGNSPARETQSERQMEFVSKKSFRDYMKLDELSVEEYEEWENLNNVKIEGHEYDDDWKERLFINQQFVEEFGLYTFKNYNSVVRDNMLTMKKIVPKIMEPEDKSIRLC